MEPARFIAMWLIGMTGVIIFFLIGVTRAIKVDPNTPGKFNARLFLFGFIRVVISIVIIAIGVVYYPEFSVKILGAPEPLEINGMAAFLLGLTVDVIIKKLYGIGVDSGKVLYKKIR